MCFIWLNNRFLECYNFLLINKITSAKCKYKYWKTAKISNVYNTCHKTHV